MVCVEVLMRGCLVCVFFLNIEFALMLFPYYTHFAAHGTIMFVGCFVF